MSERPDISRMLEDELAKKPAEAAGEKPVDTGSFDDSDEDIDAAVDSLRERTSDVSGELVAYRPEDAGANAEQARKLAAMGESAARDVQRAFEKKDIASLNGIVDALVAKAEQAGGSREAALSVLTEQLKAFHDSYFEAGLTEKASEIDAFSRSLTASAEVRTDAGKGFVSDLAGGKFASLEDAMNALDAVKDAALAAGKSDVQQTKAEKEEALNQLNNEFNLLYKAAQDKLGAKRTTGGTDAFTAEDEDDLLAGLGS